jgi:NADH-quinone oxidoreductase subunit C
VSDQAVVVADQDPIIARVKELLGDQISGLTVTPDAFVIEVGRERLIELATILRDDPDLRFNRYVDGTAIDYLNQDRTPRFTLVIHLHALAANRYVRIRVPVDEDEPEVPSLTDLWPGANYFEREVHDMFGIRFAGHPNLAPILLPDDWDVNPLRKDFQPPKEPIEFSFNPDQWQKAVPRGE